MSTRYLLLKGGRVIDPANKIDREPFDVLFNEKKVIEVGEDVELPEGGELLDVRGCLVCPGLIDLHVHCFPGGTLLGVDPDEWCLKRGVTTVVDAGSAGPGNFESFLSYSKTRNTRIFFFLHIARVGLEGAGCASDEGLAGDISDLNDVDEHQCLDCIAKHPDEIVGVKIRLAAQLANNGKNEKEAYRRALSVTEQCKIPLMVHHAFSTIPVGSEDPDELSSPGSLRKGDIRTHMLHAFESGIVDTTTNPPSLHPAVVASRERGVLHDIGHGQGSFSWTVGELCAEQSFWPDTISSDHHTGSIAGPAYDLTTVMSRMLHLGMSLSDIIKAVTVSPAKAIGKENEIGSLSPGRDADITVLQVCDCNVMLEDCHLDMRRLTRRFQPVEVFRSGKRITIEDRWSDWPNRSDKYLKEQERINTWKK